MIYILCDCDCDGVLSSSLIYQYLKLLESSIKITVLYHKGKKHGIYSKIMEQIADNSIVLLPDAGVNSQENADELAKRNIKCIEIDHHNTMVLNGVIQVNAHHSPNVTNKSGSGTLCTHKLSQYIDKQTNNKFSSQFIDLVALSIISDSCSVVSLENQCYVYYGLRNIKNPFLKYLCDNLIDGVINPHELSFKIIPLINSVQRSDDQELKEKIFKCFVGEYDNFEEVLRSCQSAHAKQNRVVKLMVDELSPLVNPTKNIIIQFAEDIDVYTGLVAQRISSKFNKPTLILHEKSDEPNKYIGSVRSNIPIRQTLRDSGLFTFVEGKNHCPNIPFPIY